MTTCVTDFDCDGAGETCFNGVSWLPENVTSVCGCYTVLGWTGRDCQGLSYQTAIMIASVVTTLVLAFVGLMYSIRFIVQIAGISTRATRWNNQNATLLFSTLSVFGILVWRAITLYVIFTPELFTLQIATTDEKTHPGLLVEKAFVGMGVVFAMLAALNVSVAWIEVARKSAKMMNVKPNSLWGEHTRWIYWYQAFFLLVVLVSSALASLAIAVIASIPFFVIIVITYIYGLFKMNALLKLMGESIENSSMAGGPESPRGPGFSLDDAEEGSAASSPGASSPGAPPDSLSAPTPPPPGMPALALSPSASPSASPGRMRGVVRSMRMPVPGASFNMGKGKGKGKARSKSLVKRDKRSRRNEYYRLLRKVRRTAVHVLASSVLLIITASGFAFPQFLYGFRERCPIGGDVCWLGLFGDLMSLALLVMVLAIQRYIYHNIRARLDKHASRASRISTSQSALDPRRSTGYGKNKQSTFSFSASPQQARPSWAPDVTVSAPESPMFGDDDEDDSSMPAGPVEALLPPPPPAANSKHVPSL